jgi:YidC/Oxa1 family membrane protein insertase
MLFATLTAYNGAILGPVAKLLGYILEGIYIVMDKIGVQNIGVCIIIFTFLIRGITLPAQIKQQKFSRMSSVLNPEIKKIQDKYKNKKDQDSQRLMSLEMNALYSKYGVSPTSGCLPMVLVFVIFFALYRVIYNIPAYVPQVYKIYQPLADALMKAGATVEKLAGKEYVTSNTYVVQDALKKSADAPDNINYFIDILSQYTNKSFDKLADAFPKLADQIAATSSQADHINSFLGLNVAGTPINMSNGFQLSDLATWGIIIPILAMITQAIGSELSFAYTPGVNDTSNPTAATSMQTMKMMNRVMPLVSGFMCLAFPIGVGIYWIAGNVFMIFQVFFINLYFNKKDLFANVEENSEKSRQKFKKMGLSEKDIDSLMSGKGAENINLRPGSNNSSASAKNGNNSSRSQRPVNNFTKYAGKASKSTANIEINNDTKYKKGSIGAYANMLRHDNGSDNKGDNDSENK